VSDQEISELRSIVGQLKTAPPPEARKNLIAQGLAWTTRNADKIGTISTAIRAWMPDSF